MSKIKPGLEMYGSKIFNIEDFKNHMNHFYSDKEITGSVEKLQNSNKIDIETLEYGQYQPILSPLEEWPCEVGQYWVKSVSKARLSLTGQANTDALSKDEPDNKPLTKCALLDAAVRKCFNQKPPIPIEIDVGEQPADAPHPDQHDIKLDWKYGSDGRPSRLKLTMVCAYLAPVP